MSPQGAPFAGFRNECPPSWPTWARDWAGSRGSLTAHLVSLGHGFSVKPVGQQGMVALNRRQAGWLGYLREVKARSRSVQLQVGSDVVVAARTWMAVDGPRRDWRFWNGLGHRSLGTMLFSDPLVSRGKVHYSQLPLNSDWVVQILGDSLYCRMIQDYRPDRWFVRAAQFTRPPGHTPLWVFEVFLPSLQKHDFGKVE